MRSTGNVSLILLTVKFFWPSFVDYLIVICLAGRTPQGKKRAEKESVNPFDRTMIHPESYNVAQKFVGLVGVHQQDIGSDHFIRSIQHFMQTASELGQYGNSACLDSDRWTVLLPLDPFYTLCLYLQIPILLTLKNINEP